MARYLPMVEDSLKKLYEWIIRRVSWKEKGKVNILVGIVATLPIKEAVILLVYHKDMPSITPEPVCNTS